MKTMGTEMKASTRRVDRREFLAIGIGAFVIGAVPFARAIRANQLFRRTVPLMGTIAEISVVHGDATEAQAAIAAAVAALRAVESRFSRFTTTSEVGRINQMAGREAVAVSDEALRVIEQALGWARRSKGAFDPCLARAVELWDVTHRTEPPRSEELRRFAGQHLYEQVERSYAAGKAMVGLRSRDAALDLGGIAKGYGVDRAVGALRRHGIEHAIVDVGGDLYALGEAERGEPWRVGIRSPHDPARIDRTIPISNAAVATSGDYMQFFEHQGRRYHHLLDPVTAEPVLRRGASVTIVADDCMTADAAATAAFAMDDTFASGVIAAAGIKAIRVS
jgi:FAD:protein FMN transferase